MRSWATAGLFISVAFTTAGTVSAGRMPPGGELIYRMHCVKCHGADGAKGKAGKNNLQRSVISGDAITQQIMEGKKGMPSFKKKLSPDEISAVSDYVISLRK